jgi:pimeloyl-ACP methyl ester carboxylesterase
VPEALQEILPPARGQVAAAPDATRMLPGVESGTGVGAVILTAGQHNTVLSWGPVALAGLVCPVAYDCAGLGGSDPDPDLPWAERSVADLSTSIDADNAEPRFAGGQGYGGRLALLLAASHPGQLARMAHVGPTDRLALVAEAIAGCGQ